MHTQCRVRHVDPNTAGFQPGDISIGHNLGGTSILLIRAQEDTGDFRDVYVNMDKAQILSLMAALTVEVGNY